MKNPVITGADQLRQRQARRQQILSGDTVMTVSDRRAALPPLRDNPAADLRQLALIKKQKLKKKDDDKVLLAAIENALDAPTAESALALRALLPWDREASCSLNFLAMLMGDEDAVFRHIQGSGYRPGITDIDRFFGDALIVALTRDTAYFTPCAGQDGYEAGDLDFMIDCGIGALKVLRDSYDDYVAATTEAAKAAVDEQSEIDALNEKLDDTDADLPSNGRGFSSIGKPSGLVVIPALPKLGTGGQRDARAAFKDLAGKPLPLVTRGDVGGHARALKSRWPHAAGVIDTILGDLAAVDPIRFRPTLLVGAPGSGKTSLARAIAEQLGLPCQTYNMSGVHDASLIGTSGQWATARPSVVLQLVQASGKANGLLLWDEIEKVSQSRHNGNPVEGLLPFFETSQSRAIRDLALDSEVDLSMISHFATANDLGGVPDPVRDRMRIIKMPDPEWQHVSTLSRQILDDLAAEWNRDPRWHEDLAQDELDVIKHGWNGGSLRQLRVSIMATIATREAWMARA